MARRLRILHMLRSPVGGLYRHVRDLVRAQSEAGHAVGLLVATPPPDPLPLALGIFGAPRMRRLPSLNDLSINLAFSRHWARLGLDIIHGHGAKGGFHARLAGARLGVPALYTPHGGSLHYRWSTPAGLAYLGVERLLRDRTQGLLFVCDHEAALYERLIGTGGLPRRVVHNGIWPEEFAAVNCDPHADELLFIGELRHLKGLDVLIDAIALADRRLPLRLAVVGNGPDQARFAARALARGIAHRVTYHRPRTATEAFRLGRILVVPSRAEAFPYVVLEAVAAEKTIIASNVGGIPEILEPEALVPAGDAEALLRRIVGALEHPERECERARSRALTARSRFSAAHMAEAVTGFYETVLMEAGERSASD